MKQYDNNLDASEHYHEIEYGEGGVAKAKEIIINKIGFNESSADYLVSQSEKFAIWLADSILKKEMKQSYGGTYEDKDGTFGYGFIKVKNDKVAKKGLVEWQKNQPNWIRIRYSTQIREILDWLQHPVTPKQELKTLSFDEALAKAKQWHDELKILGGDIDFVEPETNTILKKYAVNSDGIGYYWVFIPSNYCDLESSRMGHCGRTGYGNKLISLRSVKPYGKGHTISDSHVTIAYGSDGMFYQVKGKKNNKPAEKYFPYIFDLLKSMLNNDINKLNSEKIENINSEIEKINKGIENIGNELALIDTKSIEFNAKTDAISFLLYDKGELEKSLEKIDLDFNFNGFGSEYGAEEDYGFEDMTKEQIREMYDLKPTLFESAEDNYMLLDAGVLTLDEFKEIVEREPDTFSSFGNQMKLYERGIITEQPNTSFELEYKCDDVYRLLDIDRDFSDDLVSSILCGDNEELYDNFNYYYDNASDLVDSLNKKNEQRVIDEIIRITKLDESVVKENGIEYYLNGDDENFSPNDDFDNIIRTLASAQNQADNNDYHKYLYDALESALNELGEVHSLNDEGLKMTIDLSNSMTLQEIADNMDKYEFSDIEDLFNEIIGNDIDTPRLRIDDRYSPYGSSEDFNEYVSDTDLEQGYAKGGFLKSENLNKKNKMAITTTSEYGKSKSLKVNFKTGGETSKPVDSMSYSELNDYITKKYLPKLESVSMSFLIYETGFSYDYKDPKSKSLLLNYYKEQADYTEQELNDKTNYKINDWEVIRKEIDPETDELMYEQELKQDSADNTYNQIYLGIIHLDYRVYYDEEYDKWFVVIHPHLSGDIRGNYGEALILEGDDKEELFYRFYNEFISGGAYVTFNFTDKSEAIFVSEQDSDIFSFVASENNEIEKGTFAEKLIKDFDSINDKSKSDSFVESIVDVYNNNHSSNVKARGGYASSENPIAYIQILGTGEGKHFDLTEYTNGSEVMDAINDFMAEYNEKDGGNREEYEVTDWEGFGRRYYSEYMGEESFDSVLEAWDSFNNSHFPISVVEEYMNDTNNDDMEDALTSMESNQNGSYDSYEDYGYEMVNDGSYNPSDYEIYVTDTDKRIVAGEEADNSVDSMDNKELLDYADLTSDYEEVEEKISDFNSEITTIEGDIAVLEDEISDLESQLDDNDEDGIDVVIDLIVEKKDEIEEKQNSIKELEKSISLSEIDLEELVDSAKEESRSRIYDEVYTQLDKDPAEFTSELGYEKPTDATFVRADYEEIGKTLASELLAIESEDGKIYLFSNYAGGGKVLSISKPSKKYKFFVIELKSKRVLFGSEKKDDADKKKNELQENIKTSKFSVYKRDYAERRLGLDVDNTSAWINASDLSNAGKVAVKTIQKKSIGGWLERQWFEADFGDGVGATKLFAKGGKVPAYWNSGENIRVFDYKTKNFDICGGAVEMFNDAIKQVLSDNNKESYKMGILNEKKEIWYVQNSAEILDGFFGIEKQIILLNKTEKYQFDFALSRLLQSQILFGLHNKFATFKFASNHIIEMVKRLDKSQLKFSDGGKVLYDHEGDMAKSELQKIEKYAKYLDENIKTDTQLMAWVQSKISRMATDMGDVKHYMEYEVNNKKAMGGLVGVGIAVIVGALSIYFINKNKRSIKGGNQIYTQKDLIQEKKSKTNAYQKKK